MALVCNVACFYLAFNSLYARHCSSVWDKVVAGLSSLQWCQIFKCGWVHRNVHKHAQKTMGGHFENRIREQVIATFTTLIWKGNNSTIKTKMKGVFHSFVHTCYVYPRFGSSQRFRAQLDRVFLKVFKFFWSYIFWFAITLFQYRKPIN